MASADIARDTTLLLNPSERAQILYMVLLPQWTYVSLFILFNSIFFQVDKEISAYVIEAKGIQK